MLNNLGYKKNLFILPFDHRSSFVKLFGLTNAQLNYKEKKIITSAKQIIYQAFEDSISKGIPKEESAILIDEEYGDKIIRDAINKDYNVILTTEKSGQKEFTFEYGNEFSKHIEKYKPTFAKALIRYKPNVDWSKLKLLADYCRKNNYKFLLEVLLNSPINTSQKALEAIYELHRSGVEPDVWKLEGMESQNAYQEVIAKIQEGERLDVGLVVLGRGENEETVKKWITDGAKVKGVIGFAIGRTIFLNPLRMFRDGKIKKEQTIETISNKFIYFYNLFTFHTL